MADNTTLSTNVGSGDVVRDKDRAGVKTQIVALDLTPAGGSETLMNGSIPVTDNSGSLTVDAPVGTPVFVRLSDGSSAIATLPVSIASLPGQAADNAAALPAVLYVVGGWDGTNVQALTTDSSGMLQVDIAGALPAGTNNIGDVDVLTLPANASVNNAQVAGTATSVNSGLKDAGTQRVILASDQTVVPVSDNAGSLTVDNAGTFAVQIAANSSVNLAQVAGTTTDTNSGVKSAGTQRVVLATDQPQLTNALKTDGSAVTQPVSNAGTFATQDSEKIADDAAFTVGTTKVQPVGYLADQTATDSVNEGDIGAARITLDRKQIVTTAPSADTEGWDVKNCTSGDGSTALTNSAQAIKASPGKIGGWYIYNPNTSATYVPIYNVAAASVTVGTTNPLMVLCIPASSAANVEFTNGIMFDTAISASAVTTGGGSTAPTTALDANFYYK